MYVNRTDYPSFSLAFQECIPICLLCEFFLTSDVWIKSNMVPKIDNLLIRFTIYL